MTPQKRNAILALLFIGTAMPLALGSGCAGTSPAVNPPQMQTPSLRQRGASGGGAGATDAVRSVAENSLAPLATVVTPKEAFTVLPYIQLGNEAKAGSKESVAVLWQAPASEKRAWMVEMTAAGGATWAKIASAPVSRPLNLPEMKPQQVWTANVTGLEPGALFDYRILADGKPVFAARARARVAANAPSYRFVVFGDCGTNSNAQKEIAYQTAQIKPDFVFITGDVVYDRGRYSEYKTNFFPIYNADAPSAAEGAPLLRSTLMIAAPGNHDLSYKSMDKWPDGLAYFYVWDFPQNGPNLAPGAKNTPRMNGDDAAEKALMAASGPAYPRMANYSFDYGNSHWTVLDSNEYMDWTDAALRAWLEKDLAAAKGATWRFVSFHHPPFHSSDKHKDDQWMRVLTPTFEKYGVSVVWCGHVHNYQRSYPLRFAPTNAKPDKEGRVAGTWTLDKTYDGMKATTANAPIYIVTGGGGASLYDPEIKEQTDKWQPFTKKYEASVRSLSSVEVEGKTLTVRQIGQDGKELDRWILTR